MRCLCSRRHCSLALLLDLAEQLRDHAPHQGLPLGRALQVLAALVIPRALRALFNARHRNSAVSPTRSARAVHAQAAVKVHTPRWTFFAFFQNIGSLHVWKLIAPYVLKKCQRVGYEP